MPHETDDIVGEPRFATLEEGEIAIKESEKTKDGESDDLEELDEESIGDEDPESRSRSLDPLVHGEGRSSLRCRSFEPYER